MFEGEKGVDIEKMVRSLSYDPETGHLTWVSDQLGYLIGRRAGSDTVPHGARVYRVINIQGKTIKEHRVVWCLVHREWPSGEIDHINGIANDNRIDNLRVVTRSQNMHNCRIASNNTTGFTGVVLRPESGRYRATIMVNRQIRRLGVYNTKEEAAAAYHKASKELVKMP